MSLIPVPSSRVRSQNTAAGTTVCRQRPIRRVNPMANSDFRMPRRTAMWIDNTTYACNMNAEICPSCSDVYVCRVIDAFDLRLKRKRCKATLRF
jgi:hypothetical protein